MTQSEKENPIGQDADRVAVEEAEAAAVADAWREVVYICDGVGRNMPNPDFRNAVLKLCRKFDAKLSAR